MEFSRILVCTSLSGSARAALRPLLALAAPGVCVTLCHVVDALSDWVPVSSDLRGLVERGAERAQSRLWAEAEWLEASGLTVEPALLRGEIAPAVLEEAARRRAELVVVGALEAEGRSVPLRLMRASTAPVLVAPRQPGPPLAQVLCPVDLSPGCVPGLAAGQSIGARLGLPVSLHFVAKPPRSLASLVGAADPGAIALASAAGAALEAFAVHHGAATLARESEVSMEPADRIAALAQPGTLTCMTSRGRGELERLLLGSTVEAVARTCRGPLLLIPSRT
jgi:nucleotide-binding universal stress UspA family protein